MCGIIGYVGKRIADRVLIDGLKKLEYRGYDSAGISVFRDNKIELFRKVGKIINLETELAEKGLNSRIGIGHTRWATHGKPTEKNAHPHISHSKKIVVVHNGIIENYQQLKKKLPASYKFISETDTEIIAHLLEYYYIKLKKDKNISTQNKYLLAMQKTISQLKGSFAIVIMFSDNQKEIFAVKKDSPLLLGIGINEMFITSDITAILSYTNRSINLEDGDFIVISKNKYKIFDKDGKETNRKINIAQIDTNVTEKSGYKHFMLKEIHEQPQIIEDIILTKINRENNEINFRDLNLSKKDINNISRVIILACGTSYHAGLIGKFLIEDLAQIPCEVDVASEFRYRSHNRVIDKDCFVIAISQSGETADTIASFNEIKKLKPKNLMICNVINSTLTKKADNVIYTRCGTEIGVASTKAFTSQLCILFLVSLFLGRQRNILNDKRYNEIICELLKIPQKMKNTIDSITPVMEYWGKHFYQKNSFLYLGRNINYPIALEGALKLKEISYIHAEGYPAGEMKHGPIALIDENMPVLTIATESNVYEKVASNVEEARARNGKMLVIATEGNKIIKNIADFVCFVPKTLDILSPIINIIPLQFLAYFIAEMRGCDIDQPRNLAKSVTVE
ncbi:MAG: glutamine--fructose-6-phosphate transaminase (isomerizing) [Elusimicrobiota bacterium]|jgi:glucosamine--fructose-6-phosphate aminotransferase (isomerizing)|nr:glutamine--fructose-6-phosphate transaminase (isomerizing) [Elusimicrobiota bacterium]